MNIAKKVIKHAVQIQVLRSASNNSIRGNYAVLNANHLNHFENMLGANGMTTNEDELPKYNVDWFRSLNGSSKLVLLPKTTDDVSKILEYCNNERLAVCPQGGNTGVAGGSIPVFDEIILNTTRLNDVISLDEISGALICQSGCILAALNDHIKDKKLIIPLDLGAKGSCQIGGNVSTNAGGLRVLRYGNMHGNVLGLEVVLANGTVLDCITNLKKDNTGYSLKNLFIGAEGTLGIVTKVAIQCAQMPNAINVAFLGLKSFSDVLLVLRMAKNDLSEILSAFEYIDEAGINCVSEVLGLKPPCTGFPFYVIIETSGSNSAHDEEKLHNFLNKVMENVKSTEGTIASSSSHKEELWNIRERLPEALLKECGKFYSYDFSLSLTDFEALVKDVTKRLGSSVIRCTGFGHLGDGNIHLVITARESDPATLAKIEPYVYDWVRDHKGSVSAEHGLGVLKNKYIEYSNSVESIKAMQAIKKAFDPNGIMNPYKVFK